MKKLFLILICIICINSLFAQQDSTQKKSKKEVRKERIDAMTKLDEEGVITYKKHMAGGFKFTSDGYGGFLEIGRTKSVRKSLLFQLDITERKDVKEEKQQEPYTTTAPKNKKKINTTAQ